jgi:hypothetical protein
MSSSRGESAVAFCSQGIAEPSVFPALRVLGWYCSGSRFYRPRLFLLRSRVLYKKRLIFKKGAMSNDQWIFKMRFGQSWPTTALHATGLMIKGVKPIFDSI